MGCNSLFMAVQELKIKQQALYVSRSQHFAISTTSKSGDCLAGHRGGAALCSGGDAAVCGCAAHGVHAVLQEPSLPRSEAERAAGCDCQLSQTAWSDKLLPTVNAALHADMHLVAHSCTGRGARGTPSRRSSTPLRARARCQRCRGAWATTGSGSLQSVQVQTPLSMPAWGWNRL